MNDETPRKLEARRGFSVFYKGKTLLSMIDPIAQSERVIAASHNVPRTLYFCPSPLFGYGLKTFLNTISDDSILLCVEADEELMQFTQQEICPSLLHHPQFRLISTQDPQALCTYIKTEWGARAFRRIEVIRISGGWQLHPEIYQSLEKAIQRDIAIDWGNAITLMNLGRRYALNFIRNLPLLASSYSAESINFGDKPLLVLGAGPSLDAFLDALASRVPEALEGTSKDSTQGDFDRLNHRNFRIICVDTALSALKARNIKPDLIVALEAQHWNLRDFIGMHDWQLPIAMDLSALPATNEQLGGQTFLFTTPWTELSIFQRLKASGLSPLSMMPLGSVGLTAVLLALKLSSGPIITAGLDFSFHMDSYHAKETPSWKDFRRRQTRLSGIIPAATVFRKAVFKTTAKNDYAVYSDPGLKNYRDLFEQEFAKGNFFPKDRLRDINSSGLPLGIETIKPSDAIQLLTKGSKPAEVQFSSTMIENQSEKVRQFIFDEHQSLGELRSILIGEKNPAPGELEELLHICDYLWAHFPDYAGRSNSAPPIDDLSFLKRVRTEIDPFLKIFEKAQNYRLLH
ncbi:MAG: DUF115 domain-containing protein [Treponema sp.]|jgi:hypothetical protein|nr:DUF115 domain-containing protein [Treponema sp.]